MAARNISQLGTCPVCDAEVAERDILIEYEADGRPAAYAECPNCREVIHSYR